MVHAARDRRDGVTPHRSAREPGVAAPLGIIRGIATGSTGWVRGAMEAGGALSAARPPRGIVRDPFLLAS